jgi:hypothetical protein
MKADVIQMFHNAATFNPPNSQVCIDANKLMATFNEAEKETPLSLMATPPLPGTTGTCFRTSQGSIKQP